MSIEMEYAKQISAANGPQEQQLQSETSQTPTPSEAKKLVTASVYVDSPVNWPPDAAEQLPPITQPNVASLGSHENNVGNLTNPRNIRRNNASYRSRNKHKRKWASQEDITPGYNAKRPANETQSGAERTRMSQSPPHAPPPSFWDPPDSHMVFHETVPCQKSTSQFRQPEN
jgi:hypothetical protein